MLELAADEVNDDIWFVANKAVLPRIGTPVELIVVKPPPKDKEAAGKKEKPEEN